MKVLRKIIVFRKVWVVFIICGPWVEKFWYFGFFYRQGSQNSVLGLRKTKLRIIFYGKYKFSNVFRPSSWTLKVFCSSFFRRGFQNRLLCVSRTKYCGRTFYWENLWSFLTFSDMSEKVWDFWQMFFGKLSKLLSTCPQEEFEETKNFRKGNL